MIVERIDGLADSVLDGEASAAERAELEQLLAENPEARARFAERRELFDRLSRVPRPMPSADLRDSIMAAIEAEPHTGGPPSRGPASRGSRHSLLARHPALTLAYGLVAGLAVGTVLTLAVVGPATRTERGGQTAGTMAPPSSSNEPVLARGTLELPGAAYSGQTGLNGQGVRLLLSGQTSEPIELTVEYRPQELRLGSILPPASGDVDLSHSRGRLVLTGSGTMELELNWTPLVAEPTPIGIRGRIEDKEETMRLAVSPTTRDSPRGP